MLSSNGGIRRVARMMRKTPTPVLVGMIFIGALFYTYYGFYKILNVDYAVSLGDFRYIYDTVKIVIKDGIIYRFTPEGLPLYIYPPFSLLFYMPFYLLSLETSLALWFALSHGLVLASAYLLYLFGRYQGRLLSASSSALAFGLSMPLYFSIATGNINLIIFFGLCLTCRYLLVNKIVVTWLLSVGTCLKIYPAFYLVLFIRHRWHRLIGLFFLLTLFFSLASISVFGWAEHIQFLRTLPAGYAFIGSWAEPLNSFGFVMKTLVGDGYEKSITVMSVLFGVTLLALWWRTANKNRAAGSEAARQLTDLFVLTAVLVVLWPSSWKFFNAFFIIPFYFIVLAWLQGVHSFRWIPFFWTLFFSINLWEIVMYHIPITPEGLTMWAIGEQKRDFPLLYPLTYSLPFILDLLLYAWFLANYRALSETLSDLLKPSISSASGDIPVPTRDLSGMA